MSLKRADIDFVLDNLSEVSRDELRVAGVSLSDTRKALQIAGGEVLWRDGKPMCLFGAVSGYGGLELFNLTTEAYYATPLRSLRESRAALARLRKAHSGRPMVAHTYSSHPKARQWVALLGLRPIRTVDGVLLSILPEIV